MSDLRQELASLRIDRDDTPRRPWRRRLLLFAPVAALLVGLYAYRSRNGWSAVEVETTSPARVSVGSASVGSPILTASGYLVPRRKAVVSAKIQGRLAELHVEEGSRIRKGELIARLESTDYDAQVSRERAATQRAQAELEESRRQLRLAERLAQEQVLAQDQLEAAQSRVRLSEAALSQARAEMAFAEAQRQNTRILAPFTGTVVKKMAEVGESVAPIPPGVNLSTSSGAVVALADLDTLEVEADVSESNVAKLHAAQPSDVIVEAFPERKYHGVLRQIIPTADRTKATVQVKVTIVDKDADLKPEMSAKVTFLEAASPEPHVALAEPVVVVAPDAVVKREGRSVVFEVRQGRAFLRPVVTAGERQGRLVITHGLSGTEMLVARPAEGLGDGAPIRIKKSQEGG